MNSTSRLIEQLTDAALGRGSGSPVLVTQPERGELANHLQVITENAAVDTLPTPVGRQVSTKRLVLKLGRFVFVRQRAVNESIAGIVDVLTRDVDALTAIVHQERRRAAAAQASLDATLAVATDAAQCRVDGLVETTTKNHDELIEATTKNHDELIEATTKNHDELIEATTKNHDELVELSDARHHELTRTIATLNERIDELEATAEDRAALASRRIDDLLTDVVHERHRRQVVERELAAVKRELSVAHRGGAPDDRSAGPAVPRDTTLNELYSRFEAQFRPPGPDLDDRFTSYVSDLDYLAGGSLPVIDIGTGRGEFLAVLRDADIPARGFDANAEAVEFARLAGLEVELADTATFLSALPSESVGALTAFHIVEHLGALEVVDLIDQAVRVLVPSGTLIIETPNPTNLVVGASSFYHDPTHRRPLTPDYLAFLLRDRGLVDLQVRFLHPLPEYELAANLEPAPGNGALRSLIDDVRWALKGPQDFAVIARAPARS